MAPKKDEKKPAKKTAAALIAERTSFSTNKFDVRSVLMREGQPIPFRVEKAALEKPCATYKEKGKSREPRLDRAQLEFFSPEQAATFNTKPGANLRLCFTSDHPGYLIPVASPEDINAVVAKANGQRDASIRPRVELLAKERWGGKDAPLGR